MSALEYYKTMRESFYDDFWVTMETYSDLDFESYENLTVRFEHPLVHQFLRQTSNLPQHTGVMNEVRKPACLPG